MTDEEARKILMDAAEKLKSGEKIFFLALPEGDHFTAFYSLDSEIERGALTYAELQISNRVVHYSYVEEKRQANASSEST